MPRLQGTALASRVPRDRLRAIVLAVLLYAVIAALWILFSDRAVESLLRDPDSLAIANTLKGLFFVSVTSLLLLYLLVRFAAEQAAPARHAKENRPRQGWLARGALYLGLALLGGIFLLAGALGIKHSRDSYREAAGRQLQSIAQLKVGQLEDWLDERYGDARLAGASPTFNKLAEQWRQGGNPAIGGQLAARLEAFRATYRYSDVLICDTKGDILLRADSGSGHALTDALRETLLRSLARNEVLTTGFSIMETPAPAHMHLDFVAPLLMAGEQGRPEAAIVLRANVEASIHSRLQNWPVPSESAEIILFQREGNRVHHMNRLRHKSGEMYGEQFPLTQRQRLAAQALAPGYKPGALIEGIDYRSVPVMGAAQPVTGTSWWLLAKIDRDEIFGAAHRDALWIAFTGLLAWLVTATLAIMLLQRRELLHSRRQQHEQAEQLNALKLLSDIAYGSADAIFAKDRQGRYLMFNRAACGFAGKTEDQVVGQDDSVLFPPEQAALVRAHDRQVMEEDRIITSEETLDTPAGTLTFLAIKGPLHDENGRVTGMYGISRDITERSKSEDSLRRGNEELQRFNRAMIGRELEMIRLKREANELAAALGRQPPYDLSAIDDARPEPDAQQDAQP